MSEVVPLPSFGEVFFDARGQERCLRVTWHEGTLVLSLWRGEMCTASFRMPMDDVGRLLDTLDEGFAEATGEQPAVPAHDPEVIPGTGQYHRPPDSGLPQPPHYAQPDERPTAALSPNDVLVARGAPAPPDKLVASYDTTPPREMPIPGYGEQRPAYNERQPAYNEQYTEQQPAYGERQSAYNDTPLYNDTPAYGDQQHYGGYQAEQTQPVKQPFTGPQYVEPAAQADPFYQLPGTDSRGRQAPLSTDPLGFPSQAAEPYQQAAEPYQAEPYQHGAESYQQGDGYQQGYQPRRQYTQQPDPYTTGQHSYQQPPPPQRERSQGAAGLGTPMHGIPGAGRRAQQDYHSGDHQPYQAPANPVDPLLAMSNPVPPHQPELDITRPYVGDPMFSTGERLRPEQQYDDRGERREW
ncbi:hypothetical protein ACIBEJ_12290 [Nonomuraea sp. NPDC050790]|uniref:hypothetical protein n=1 Tax=Nonomuraea sp. NPDC050790 TaxID=3364371 RepID=UPI00378FDD3F